MPSKYGFEKEKPRTLTLQPPTKIEKLRPAVEDILTDFCQTHELELQHDNIRYTDEATREQTAWAFDIGASKSSYNDIVLIYGNKKLPETDKEEIFVLHSTTVIGRGDENPINPFVYRVNKLVHEQLTPVLQKFATDHTLGFNVHNANTRQETAPRDEGSRYDRIKGPEESFYPESSFY